MDQIKEIYEQLKSESDFSYHGIDLSYVRDSFLNALKRAKFCVENGIAFETDAELQKLLSAPKRPESKQHILSREERFLKHARMIKDYNLDNGTIIDCNKYLVDYGSMSYEQFCSYLYWRTKIRRHNYCETPIGYLRLYLIEICNYIEYDAIDTSWNALLTLSSKFSSNHEAKREIDTALSDFALIYLSKEEASKYDYYEHFRWVEDHLLFLQGAHPDPFGFITSKASHKLKKSVVYKENPEKVETAFLHYFAEYLDLLRCNDIDLIPLWIGKHELHKFWSHYIKEINANHAVEKVFTAKGGEVIMQVGANSAEIATMVSQGQEIDPGQRIFNGRYIIDYLIRAFENEWRKRTGKRRLKLTTQKIREMGAYGEHPLLNKIIEIYESQDFDDLVKQCIDKESER